MINFKEMMDRAQKMQFKMQEMQAKLEDVEVSGESGGGLVKVRMTCDGTIRGLELDPSVLSGEKEVAEDLITAALNNTNKAKENKIKEETEAMIKKLGIPEDTKLPFNS